MYTDRARKVMQLALQEAVRLNHEYVGTEHILLGLVAETGGTSATILNRMGIEAQKVVDAVNKIVISGPVIVTVGKRPQTPRGKKVIEYAAEEAAKLGHNYIGTEHLLLGLLKDPEETVSGKVLADLGLKFDVVLGELFALVSMGRSDKVAGAIISMAEEMKKMASALIHMSEAIKTMRHE